MLIQCKTTPIEETTEEQQQIIGHFISLEKSHTTCHLELFVRLPDEATRQSRFIALQKKGNSANVQTLLLYIL